MQSTITTTKSTTTTTATSPDTTTPIPTTVITTTTQSTTTTTTKTLTTATTTSSAPVVIPDGLNNTSFHNYKPSFLLNKGYSIVYNKEYSHITTTAEIEAIRFNCGPKSVLCMGDPDSRNEDRMGTFVCGNCEIITRKTTANSPNYHNGFTWYNTPNDRIGCDRIKWNLDKIGGGSLDSYVNPDAQYYKMLFIKSY
jgi:hypothetical protein